MDVVGGPTVVGGMDVVCMTVDGALGGGLKVKEEGAEGAMLLGRLTEGSQ